MTGLNEKYDHFQKLLLTGILILLIFPVIAYAQPDRKYIRQGNHQYGKSKYPESEISYRKASDKNKESSDAIFNTGDALYRQKKYEEAGKEFAESHKMNEDKKKKSESLFNLGNSLLMANKVQESIDAYKGSLKIIPDSKEAKYNLAYAQDLLKKQQEQQKQQQQKDQNKDQKDKQQNKDQKNNQDKKDQNQDKNKQPQDQQQQQKQQQEQGISKEDAQRVLDAVANDEKNVQEKVKLAKATREKVKTVKNW
jgi:tetratricopeptide (TPR) repeat protein